MKMKPYLLGRYLIAFVKIPLQSMILLEGFWPSNNWNFNYVKASLSIRMDVVDLEDPIRVPYCGPKNMKPLTAYKPFRYINVGDFVLVRLHDLDLVLLWMGRMEGDVIKDEENEYFKMVRVQCWVLVKKRSNLDKNIYMKIVGTRSENVI